MKLDLSVAMKEAYARGELAVVSAERKTATNGAYAMLTLTDGNRDIVGKRWKYDGELPAVGSVIDIVAEVAEYKGVRDLNIKRWTAGETPASEFKKLGFIHPEELYDRLIDCIESIDNTDYKVVVSELYVKHKDWIMTAPAAKTVHHDYEGGFMQHTLEVTLGAIASAKVMQDLSGMKIDMSLLIAGALLHDIGKLFTYQLEGAAIEMTNDGQFLEHIVIGTHMVMTECSTQRIDKLYMLKLTHCIGAHHMELEWGSPIKPVIPEAMLIHYADQVSAKCTIVDNARKNCDSEWTAKNFFLGARVYNGN